MHLRCTVCHIFSQRRQLCTRICESYNNLRQKKTITVVRQTFLWSNFATKSTTDVISLVLRLTFHFYCSFMMVILGTPINQWYVSEIIWEMRKYTVKLHTVTSILERLWKWPARSAIYSLALSVMHQVINWVLERAKA